jgi:hypothetical protein
MNWIEIYLQQIAKNTAGSSTGLATSADIATVVAALAKLPNVEINTEQINLNVQDLEDLVTITNALLTTIRNQQIDKSQFAKITDGTDDLVVNADGSLNITSLGGALATQTTLAGVLTELQLKADLTETQPVSVATLPLPTGASTLLEQQTQTATLATISGNVVDIENNVTHKLNRIKGSDDYTATITYIGATTDVNTITHNGTTALGAETLTVTYGYDGSNRINAITYS